MLCLLPRCVQGTNIPKSHQTFYFCKGGGDLVLQQKPPLKVLGAEFSQMKKKIDQTGNGDFFLFIQFVTLLKNKHINYYTFCHICNSNNYVSLKMQKL